MPTPGTELKPPTLRTSLYGQRFSRLPKRQELTGHGDLHNVELHHLQFPRGSVGVKVLCHKPEGRGFESR
jgi:hypothetical protein